MDLGVGPVLLLSMLVYTAMKWRNVSSSALCVLAMLPFLALHHWLNYRTGGTFGPANANPEYFQYPGSPFAGGDTTGVWIHRSASNLIRYAIELWIGSKGFLLYNLPLLLVPLCAVSVWRIFPQKREELLFAALLCAGSWIVYAAGSNNFSGVGCSIRWFVPLLIPGYFALMLGTRARPELIDLIGPFKLLTGCAIVLVAVLFWAGPWAQIEPRIFWWIVLLSLIAFGGSLWRRVPIAHVTTQ